MHQSLVDEYIVKEECHDGVELHIKGRESFLQPGLNHLADGLKARFLSFGQAFSRICFPHLVNELLTFRHVLLLASLVLVENQFTQHGLSLVVGRGIFEGLSLVL